MHLTKFTDNSLRVLIYLSENSHRKATISEIADACLIPKNHLTKVINTMAQKGLVLTTRGKAGGVSMARPAETLKVGDVIRAMEGTKEIINCDTPKCPLLRICELRSILREGQNAFLDTLDKYSVADLTN